MSNRLSAVQELQENFKKAFMPVPPHPDHAPPADPAAQGAPPPAGPPAGAPPQGAPPQQGPPPTDPATGAPIDPATGQPTADPGPPPVNPDIIALMNETVSKVEEFSKIQQSISQRQDKIEQEIAHDRALRDQRKTLVDTLVQS